MATSPISSPESAASSSESVGEVESRSSHSNKRKRLLAGLLLGAVVITAGVGTAIALVSNSGDENVEATQDSPSVSEIEKYRDALTGKTATPEFLRAIDDILIGYNKNPEPFTEAGLISGGIAPRFSNLDRFDGGISDLDGRVVNPSFDDYPLAEDALFEPNESMGHTSVSLAELDEGYDGEVVLPAVWTNSKDGSFLSEPALIVLRKSAQGNLEIAGSLTFDEANIDNPFSD